MTGSTCRSAMIIAMVSVLTAGVSSSAIAQTQQTTRTIAETTSIFIDDTALIGNATAERDVSLRTAGLGARDNGPGAITFRENNRPYILDAPPLGLRDQDRQRSFGALDGDRQRSYCAGMIEVPRSSPATYDPVEEVSGKNAAAAEK